MERQQEQASKESFKEHVLKEIAESTGANNHDLRHDSHQKLLAARVENALHFDIAQRLWVLRVIDINHSNHPK